METLEFVAETAGERIDALLPRIAADLTRSGAQRLLEAGAVLVNGRPVQKSYKLAVGDAVCDILAPAEGAGGGNTVVRLKYEKCAVLFASDLTEAEEAREAKEAEREPEKKGFFARFFG